MNISGTLNAFRILISPSLLLPHATVPSFNDIPIPVSQAFTYANSKHPDIQAVVLDKDNCFAVPHQLTVHKPYVDKFNQLKKAYPGNKLIIVSNSSGTTREDPDFKEASLLTLNTGIHVLKRSTKKPGCHPSILAFLSSDPSTGVTSPDQVAVIGDRLFTDMVMANQMGSWGLWVRGGIDMEKKDFFGAIERRLASMLQDHGFRPPIPISKTAPATL